MGRPPIAPGRRWLFRLAAIAAGLLPLLLAELALRALDLGRPEAADDPFLGFSAVRPLFVRDDSGTRYVTSPARLTYFRPESFAAAKPAGEFRIFCLGGSTVQGRPYAVETSFTTWLELALRAAEPSRRWEVVNCGGVSYASYRLVPILAEVLANYDPDLIILYTGHNEFLEDRTYPHLKRMPAVARVPLELVAGTRLFGALRAGVSALAGPPGREPVGRPVLGPEVDALLDYRGGLEAYHRDDAWRRDVIDHYEFNLRRMVRMARGAGVPVVLANPVCNLDHPPFKSLHGEGLPADVRRRVQALRDAARAHYGRNPAAVVGLLDEASALDPRHAGLHYVLAKANQDLGWLDDAKDHFVRAKDEDVCPLRILEPMNAVVLDVGRGLGVPVVDVRALFEARSEGGIPGGDWLVDHVHPSISGHRLIAAAFLGRLEASGLVDPEPGWEDRRDRLYRDHEAGLGDFYYLKAEQRLEGLRNWAAGRGSRIREARGPEGAG